MQQTIIETRIKAIICETLGVKEDEVSPDAHFDTDLGADPLDIIEIILACEDEWYVHITEDEAEAAYTYGLLVDLISRKAAEKETRGGRTE